MAMRPAFALGLLVLLLLLVVDLASAFLPPLPLLCARRRGGAPHLRMASHANGGGGGIAQQLGRLALVGLALLGPVAVPHQASAFDARGAKLFEENCSSCHVGGGNIIGYARGKTLKEDALKKNKVDSRESIVTLLEKGAGVMPKYSAYVKKNGDAVPAKLSEADMGLVADFVIEQAKAGWK